jgi:hypothetical protein
MARNDCGEAIMPLLGAKKESAQVRDSERWEEIKPDALRLYWVEKRGLKATKKAIEKIYGFKKRYVGIRFRVHLQQR